MDFDQFASQMKSRLRMVDIPEFLYLCLLVAILTVVIFSDDILPLRQVWIGDGGGNLARAYYVRQSPTAVLWTEQWFGGYSPLFHPYSKVLYPLWWVVYIPTFPLVETTKVVILIHMAASGIITYYYSHRVNPKLVAGLLAILSITPAGAFGDHLWKYLAWPWLVFAIWQIAPWTFPDRPRRWGFCAGLGLAICSLTGGGLYYTVIGGIVVVPFVFRDGYDALTGAIIGGIPGLLKAPAVISSVGASRPTLWYYGWYQIIPGLTGFGFDYHKFGIYGFWEYFAVIGIVPIALFGAGAGVAIWRSVPSRNWWLTAGVTSILLVLFTLAIPQRLLGISVLRTTPRGVSGLALLILVGTAVLFATNSQEATRGFYIAIIVLLAVSTIHATYVATMITVPHTGSMGVTPAVAGEVKETQCGPVWIESGSTTSHYKMQFGLAREGIAVVNPRYSEGFVAFSARSETGELRPEVILFEGRPGGDRIKLNRTMYSGTGASVRTDSLTEVNAFQNWRIYTTSDCNKPEHDSVNTIGARSAR